MKQNHTLKLAFCGITTALALLFICLGGLIPVMTYAMPALAGVMLIPVVAELGVSWAWPVFAASALLGALLGPDKDAAAIYILFFGYYPIVKAVIERHLHRRSVQLLVKLLLFNAAMAATFAVSVYLLAVPLTAFSIAGVSLPGVLLLLGNVVFLVYDYAVNGVVLFYFHRLHGLIHKWLFSGF